MKSAEHKPIKELLWLDSPTEVIEKITNRIKKDVPGVLKKLGAVVGISGGLDSSVTLALAVKALGNDHVIGVIIPETESSGESSQLAEKIASQLGVKTMEINISGALESLGCYKTRDAAVARVFPEFIQGKHSIKIGIKKENIFTNLPPVFHLSMIEHNGKERTKILPVQEYLDIMASTNFKQRTRTSVLYHVADRFNYAVMGTSNRDELYLGFFVKIGDGSSDLVPISSLYKTQVFQLAENLNIPEDITKRIPATDTYSAHHSQEDFFYQLPFDILDIFLYGIDNQIPAEDISMELGFPVEKVRNVITNLKRKHNTTEYLRMNPLLF